MGNINTESDFRQWIRDSAFKPLDWYFLGIETSTKAGVPDVFCMDVEGCAFWMELKIGIGAPLIRKEQRVWGLKNFMAKGKAFVVHYNKAYEHIEIYTNPIDKVTVAGKYLRVVDKPAVVVPLHRSGFLNALHVLLYD
jgi:hypothetical protein